MWKTIINRITLIIATVLSLAFTQVTAQDLNKGLEAYNAGDFTTAMSEWKPLTYQSYLERISQPYFYLFYEISITLILVEKHPRFWIIII